MTDVLFSILTPVFDPPEDALLRCLESVIDQTMENWELCIVNDASTKPHVTSTLNRFSADPRIRIADRSCDGGIVAASRDALCMARGAFVALLDHDDMLAPAALESVALVVDQYEDVDYIYTDEDKVDSSGRFFDEFRKPDWSPERLRGQNYCAHLSIVRRSLLLEAGGFREGFDGSQDYDAILRVTEHARRIIHIPEVLYHWRVVDNSAAGDVGAKPYAAVAALRAVREHCQRVRIDAEVEKALGHVSYFRLVRRLAREPLVSIIIPTNGGSRRLWGIETSLVINAVRSVLSSSTYRNLEFIVVIDDNTPPSVVRRAKAVAGDRIRFVPFPRPFNFAEKINLGAVHAHGEVILPLNDDIQVITPDWLEIMLGLLEQDDIGMVGPRLLLADGRIQSAGHNHECGPHHIDSGRSASDPGPFGRNVIERECSGVTAACAALRREVFEAVGGMSCRFPGSYNDVDLSLKLIQRGYRIVWTPFAELYHFESLSRDPLVTTDEESTLLARWRTCLARDAYMPGERAPQAAVSIDGDRAQLA